MGVVVDYKPGDCCSECGDEDADLYTCDDCGKVICAACMPELPDEANEVCEECAAK